MSQGMPSMKAVDVLYKMGLESKKVEGKASCWNLSVLRNIKGAVENSKSPSCRGACRMPISNLKQML